MRAASPGFCAKKTQTSTRVRRAHQQFSLEVDLRAVRGLPGLELGRFSHQTPAGPRPLALLVPPCAMPGWDPLRRCSPRSSTCIELVLPGVEPAWGWGLL